MMTKRVAVLGAGLAGFGAAYRLRKEPFSAIIYEKKGHYGGNAASYKLNGFTFDYGPHISFTKNEHIQDLFAKSVDNNFEKLQARANNYWKGYWIKHPVQRNLYGLPEDLVLNILDDFIKSQQITNMKIRNFEDWLVASYGRSFAENFPMRYTRKFHVTEASNMSYEWTKPRFYRPSIREVLQGALSPSTPEVHYVDHFRYPTRGGFASYLKTFADECSVHLNHEVIRLDLNSRTLLFQNGRTVNFDHAISSIPLPVIVPMLEGVPDAVLKASQRLACSTCVLVNIGINRENISDSHWTYFYDQDISFTRLSYPHMQSRYNAPPGTGSIQAEVYYSEKYRVRDLTPDECIQPVVKDLKRCGMIREGDDILLATARMMPYANVIFDLEREEALRIVHEYMDDIGILYCGRYGEWGYLWTDESFLSGEAAAEKLLRE